ncbi:DNA polymerase III PolC-type [bacterium HR32]|nr:DNA polymerase III PolC-type [bacterium HR32]
MSWLRARSAQLLWRKAVYWCVDLETTGLDPKKDRVLALAAVPVRDGVVRCSELLAVRVRADPDSPWGGVEAHGLLPTDLEAASPLVGVLRRLDVCLRQGVLVLHGAHVDVPFLERSYRACGIPWPRPPVVDTARLLQRMGHRLRWLGSEHVPLDLGSAREHLGLPAYPRHDAAWDAVATAELLVVLAFRLRARSLGDLVRWGG